MRALFSGPALVGILVLAAGCRPPQPAPSAGAAVVVDLDVVAKALGRDAETAKLVEQATGSLNAQLVQAAQEMERQLQQQKGDLGSAPSPEAREKYRQAELRAQQNIRNNKAIAEQARQAVKDEQIFKFRAEVKPVAGRLARDRGAKLVLIANQNVIWFDSAADITADTIAAMRASLTSPLAAPEPALAPAATNTVATSTNVGRGSP